MKVKGLAYGRLVSVVPSGPSLVLDCRWPKNSRFQFSEATKASQRSSDVLDGDLWPAGVDPVYPDCLS